jgi:hypothetical protein
LTIDIALTGQFGERSNERSPVAVPMTMLTRADEVIE